MIEAKLRAWDINHKEMIYIDDLYWFEENGVHDFKGNGHCSNYLLMWYTGFQDRNKNEIFGGDIVNIIGVKNRKATVIFYHGCWMLEWDNKFKSKFTLYGTSCDVIGNIYENPELVSA